VPLLFALGACIERGAGAAGTPGAAPTGGAPSARPVGAFGLFALGYVFGFGFYLVGIHWIALLSDVAITVPWLKYPAWVAAALYLALYSGLTTLVAGVLARRGRVPLALTFPLALLTVEELRGSGLAVGTGAFGADMDIALVNQGPVTILLDSRKLF